MHELKSNNLDMSKLIAFCLHDFSTMVGIKKGVTALIRKVNLDRITTNTLCSLSHKFDTKKIPYAKHIDVLVNDIANYFSSSSNIMDAIKKLQEDFDSDVIKM